MARHREVAASPVRTAGQTWAAITDLIEATLDRSPVINGDDVRHVMDAVAPAGRALVAGGHLGRTPLVVIASPLYLTLSTVSGEAAFRALDEENPNPVPGGATAEMWTLYVPSPAGLAPLVDEVAAGVDHISTDDPPAETSTNAKSAAVIDLSRLDPGVRT